MKTPFQFVIFTLFLLGFASCDSRIVISENKSLNDAKWSRDQTFTFPFQINDTSISHNVYVNLRHGNNYAYNNLYLFVLTESPSGKTAKDTVQMILSDPKGNWLGKGIGAIYDYKFMFKNKLKFPETGNYSIRLEQAMRDPVLSEISDVGVKISKVKNNG